MWPIDSLHIIKRHLPLRPVDILTLKEGVEVASLSMLSSISQSPLALTELFPSGEESVGVGREA